MHLPLPSCAPQGHTHWCHPAHLHSPAAQLVWPLCAHDVYIMSVLMQDWEALLATAVKAARNGDALSEGCFASVRGESNGTRHALPDLTVDGVGRLSLPLPQAQAAQLLAAGEAAPFGKGMATVLDPAVRRATQLDAAKVHFGPGWERTLSDITQEAALALGLDEHQTAHVHANLYKLLLYEPGGHFAAHRDTEKEPGMFATLVVQLPVAGGHAGGVLTVRHGGRHVAWDSERGSSTCSDLQYAAFYADYEHELSAVTAGLRAVLVYNLVLQGQQGQGAPVRVPAGRGAGVVEQLQAAVRAWERAAEEEEAGKATGSVPEGQGAVARDIRQEAAHQGGDSCIGGGGCKPLVTLALEHKYTEGNLSFRGLKGHDARLVGLLQQCGGLELHLALVTKRLFGLPEGSDGHGYHERKSRSCDDDDGSSSSSGDDDDSDVGPACSDSSMVQVDDAEIKSTRPWVSESGQHVDFTPLGTQLHSTYLLPGETLFKGEYDEEDCEPDEREFEGYTGNEGPTLEYVYHRAVVVLWPRARSGRVALGAGLGCALDLLDRRMAEMGRGGGAAVAGGQGDQQGKQGEEGGCGKLRKQERGGKEGKEDSGGQDVMGREGEVQGQEAGEEQRRAQASRCALEVLQGLPALVGAPPQHIKGTAMCWACWECRQLRDRLRGGGGSGSDSPGDSGERLGSVGLDTEHRVHTCGWEGLAARALRAVASAPARALLDATGAHAAGAGAVASAQFSGAASTVDCAEASSGSSDAKLRGKPHAGDAGAGGDVAGGKPQPGAGSAALAARIVEALGSPIELKAQEQGARTAGGEQGGTSRDLPVAGLSLGLGTKGELVDAIAAVSASLASPAFDEAVVRLVREAGARHVAQAAALAVGVRHVGQAAALAAGTRHTAQAAALAAGMGQQHTAGGGGEGRAVAPLSLRVRIAEALMESTVGSPEAFGRLATADVLLLGRMVYGGAASCTTEAGLDEQVADCYAGYGERFVRAVAARPDGQGLLKVLLAEGVVRCAVQGGHPAALGLVAPRLRALQDAVAEGRPAFGGWEQPGARFPSDQKVQEFLRGPEREATFRDKFTSVVEARSWASKHFGWGSSSRDGYEADALAAGVGRKAYVTVTKTRKAYDKAVRQYESDVAELREIQGMVGGAAAAARLLGGKEDSQTAVAAAVAGGGAGTEGTGAAGEGAGKGRSKRGREPSGGGDGGNVKVKAARGEGAEVGKGVAAGGAQAGAGTKAARPTCGG